MDDVLHLAESKPQAGIRKKIFFSFVSANNQNVRSIKVTEVTVKSTFCNIRPEDTYRRITKLSLKTTG